MFKNYLVIAIRNILKNKLFAAINIIGLTSGLAVFLFAQMIAGYERSYDMFFPGAERIFAAYTQVRPETGMQFNSINATPTAVAPLVSSQVPALERVSRCINREFLAGTAERKFYQSISFVDPDFMEIFQFETVAGSTEQALTDPTSLVITERAATKYFGAEDPIGQIITFRNQTDLRVTAVIRNLPLNSHFETSLVNDGGFDMIASTTALAAMSDFDIAGNFQNISSNDTTYALLAKDTPLETANKQMDQLFETHMPEEQKEGFSGFELRPIADMNTWLWEAVGLPVISSIQLLGFLILLVAGLNYVNLATAQVMGRTREVGLRKTLGATKSQLFSQFISESVLLTLVALVTAIGLIYLALPAFNEATGKSVTNDLTSSPGAIAGLIFLVLTIGVLAGAYPAFLIIRGKIVSMLAGEVHRGRKGGILRNIMLVVQFSISIFMIIAVAIIFAQNKVIAEGGNVFPKDQIVILERISRPEINEVTELLRNELLRQPGISGVAFSGQVPFDQSHSERGYSITPGDEASKVGLYTIVVDENFTDVYDMNLLAGRRLSLEHANDSQINDDEGIPQQSEINVIINELAASQLGYATPADAIGQTFHPMDENIRFLQHHVVGVVQDTNFLGLFNEIKPIVFHKEPQAFNKASVRIAGEVTPEKLSQIDAAWDKVVPSYPVQRRFLAEIFDQIFQIFVSINAALAGFALLALLVALIGLFGLAAYIAEQRTKEVGIRKVMGATVPQITRLLVWQFSRPVFIAILLASPLGWLAGNAYLDFFSERVSLSPLFFVIAGFITLLVAALTVSFHAIKMARSNPVNALRYE